MYGLFSSCEIGTLVLQIPFSNETSLTTLDRNKFWVRIVCHGSPGHGSRFLENTAAEKAARVINRLHQFREEQRLKLESNSRLTLGDVTTVNVTMMEGGVQVELYNFGIDVHIV